MNEQKSLTISPLYSLFFHFNMTSEEETPPTPPALVRIVCSPYDSSDDDNEFVGAASPSSSFIYPSSERDKARARGGSKKITFLDGISRNAASMATHANHTLRRLVQPPETDDGESNGSYDSDDDSQRLWRKSKLDLLMVKALDKADMYAAALCNVADTVPQGCVVGNGFVCGEDDFSDADSWSSFEEDDTPRRGRRSRAKKSKRTKKRASYAVPYGDGNLSDSVSITSDDVSYTFEEAEKSPAKASSSPKKTVSIAPCPKASLIRQRREEFLRRKDSGGDGIAVSRARIAKRPQLKKTQYVPSQELRAKYLGKNREEIDKERLNHTMQEEDFLFGESIPDLVVSSSNDDSAAKTTSRNNKWQSKVALVDIPVGDSLFLNSSHLGPSVSRVPLEMGSALQMGDIILRVDGEDVSSLEGSIVENVLKSMRGKRVHVSFLRKRMTT